MSSLESHLREAVRAGELRESSCENILRMLSSAASPVVAASVEELVADKQWRELDDRFFRTLAFGTGGLRGRTIGRIVTRAEQGNGGPLGRPEHACVGTNAMNLFNLSRAVQGLVAYIREWSARSGREGRPLIVYAHDTRHFSRDFATFAAETTTRLGCDAAIFSGPRSTPELSFAVRHLGASAGVVLTASHNPPHDNGFKAYFHDGAQVVEPHASAIIDCVNAIPGDSIATLPAAEHGKLMVLGEEMDAAYMDRLETLLLDIELIRSQSGLKIVFTPIHGTGAVICRPLLERLGFHTLSVPEQEQMDGSFPTVTSPNPENAEALDMALQVAMKEDADLVMGTDPDADRMGVIVRTRDGDMRLLTGNQIGSLMAFYRVRTFIDRGLLPPDRLDRGVLIKTYVTTDLQKAIAVKEGLSCVETLTGFKYIGEKLGKYENAIPQSLRANYSAMSEQETRALRMEHSKVYVFGGEESYGYSGSDFVRDKDANGSVVMFAEVAAYARSRGMTLDELLDEIYIRYGYYAERGHSMVFEGADGAASIAALATSYAEQPPKIVDGSAVRSLRNFATDEIYDSEGDRVPVEKMLIIELEDGRRFAVRPSGTEPKIKYYLFAHRTVQGDLAQVKTDVARTMDALWAWLQADANERLS